MLIWHKTMLFWRWIRIRLVKTTSNCWQKLSVSKMWSQKIYIKSRNHYTVSKKQLIHLLLQIGLNVKEALPFLKSLNLILKSCLKDGNNMFKLIWRKLMQRMQPIWIKNLVSLSLLRIATRSLDSKMRVEEYITT